MSNQSHGNTPAAWTAVTIMMVSFFFGTLAVVLGNWPMFWIGGVGLFILGGIVGRVMAGMGYGKTPKHDADSDRSAATAESGH